MSIQKQEIWAVIYFFYLKGDNAATTSRNIHEQLPNWFQKFRGGHMSLKDESRSGRPEAMDKDVLVQMVK